MNNNIEENQECVIEKACSALHGIGESLKYVTLPLLLLFLAVLYFAWPPSTPISEDDEARYVETSRHMIETGDYVIPVFNGHVRYLKPVFIYWLQAGTMKIFNSEIPAARAESGIMMLLLTLAVFFFIRYNLRRFNRNLTDGEIYFSSFLAATAVSVTVFAAAWAHMATTDITLSVIISLCCLSLIQAEIYHKLIDDPIEEKKLAMWAYLIAGLTGGLAFLTKGPVGPGVPFAMWFVYHVNSAEGSMFSKYWLKDLFKNLGGAFKRVPWLPVLLVFIIVAAPWFILITLKDGGEFLKFFFLNENIKRASDSMEGHNFGPLSLLVYFAIAFIATFPFSVIPVTVKTKSADLNEDNKSLKIIRDFSIVWFCLVIVVFSILKTQLASYVQSIMVPVAFLFTIGIIANRQHNQIPKTIGMITAVIGMILTGGGIYLLSQNEAKVDNFISQPFSVDKWSVLVKPYALEALILFGAIFIAFSIILISKPKLEILIKFLIPSWALFLMILVLLAMPMVVRSQYGTTQAIGIYIRTELDGTNNKNMPIIALVNHFTEGLALYTRRVVTHVRPAELNKLDDLLIDSKSVYLVTTSENLPMLDKKYICVMKKNIGKLFVMQVYKQTIDMNKFQMNIPNMMEKKDGNN
jgi:4-amino-4-deoxy-L-arabinose transferase-like glycosyltransferase